MSYKEESMFTEEGFHKEMPWLTYSTMEYVPENGYQFIEHGKFLDKKINEKVSESDYYSGTRYLKIKLMGEMTAERYVNLKPVEKEDSVYRKYCRVLESDLVSLDLTQKELNDGFRYLKIYVPTGRFEEGWVTYSEVDDGWQVSYKKNKVKSGVSSSKRRKMNRRKNQQKMMDEVKKYISVE